jgi:hypothetical protein
MSIAIIRAFVQLRELLSTHVELAAKLAELERKSHPPEKPTGR